MKGDIDGATFFSILAWPSITVSWLADPKEDNPAVMTENYHPTYKIYRRTVTGGDFSAAWPTTTGGKITN